MPSRSPPPVPTGVFGALGALGSSCRVGIEAAGRVAAPQRGRSRPRVLERSARSCASMESFFGGGAASSAMSTAPCLYYAARTTKSGSALSPARRARVHLARRADLPSDKGMAQPGTLAYECRLSCISVTLQILVAIGCVLLSLYIASLLLEWINLVGITSVPPGIRYADYYHPAFVPAGGSKTPTAVRTELLRQGVEVRGRELAGAARSVPRGQGLAHGAPSAAAVCRSLSAAGLLLWPVLVLPRRPGARRRSHRPGGPTATVRPTSSRDAHAAAHVSRLACRRTRPIRGARSPSRTPSRARPRATRARL